MRIDFSSLSANQRYHVMTQVIVPRPIAWVLSDNGGEASYNLAPFSYFNAISSEPALIMLSVGHKPSGEVKDTRRNLLARKHAVIHIPSVASAQAVTDSAATLPYGESELDALALPTVAEAGWPLPRLADAPVAMACHYYDHTEIGPNKQGIIFCQVDDVFINDAACAADAKGRVTVDAGVLAPLSRLGGGEYATFGDVFSLVRPK